MVPPGSCVGDYDNDGYDDLFLTYYGKNVLYHNNGDGTFADVTEKAGLAEGRTRYGTAAPSSTMIATVIWTCLCRVTSIWTCGQDAGGRFEPLLQI